MENVPILLVVAGQTHSKELQAGDHRRISGLDGESAGRSHVSDTMERAVYAQGSPTFVGWPAKTAWPFPAEGSVVGLNCCLREKPLRIRYYVHTNEGRARANKSQPPCGSQGNIDHAIAKTWPTVIDSQQHVLVIIKVSDPDRSSKRQCRMRGCKPVQIVSLSACCCLPLKLWTVPARNSDLLSVHYCQWEWSDRNWNSRFRLR